MNSTGQPVPTGAAFILMAAMLWGTTGTAQAFAPQGSTPLAVGMMRLLIGGSALLLFALGRRQLHFRGWPRLATVIVVVSIAAYQVCFFAGVASTGVAVGTVVGIGSAPMVAGLIGLVFLGEKPTRRWLMATLLAVTGCVLLVTAGSTVDVNPLGVLLAIGAGGAYAIYTIASKRLLSCQPPDAVTAVAFFGGALVLMPLLFFVDLDWLSEPRGLLVALELGLVATALAYVFYIRGLMTVPAATAVTLALMEPLTAATLGVVVLGERLSLPALFGVGLLLAGLAILTTGNTSSRGRRQSDRSNPPSG